MQKKLDTSKIISECVRRGLHASTCLNHHVIFLDCCRSLGVQVARKLNDTTTSTTHDTKVYL